MCFLVGACSHSTGGSSGTAADVVSSAVAVPQQFGAQIATGSTVSSGSAFAQAAETEANAKLTQQMSWSLATSTPSTDAVQLTNTGTANVSFELTHNGESIYGSVADLAAHIAALPDAVPNEVLARKTWRYLHGTVIHWAPISELNWSYSALVLVNSTGFGECGQYSSAFTEVIQQQGLVGRIRGLVGHVVPEVQDAAGWHMYDPDLGVYYNLPDGTVASVDQLSADLSLILDPVNPVLPISSQPEAYSNLIAGIYGDGQHYDGTDAFLYQGPALSPSVQLPPGASFTYPGNWTGPVVGYDVSNGLVPYPAAFASEAKLDLPAGWSGTLTLPLVLWDVQGTGSVAINGTTYAAGSPALTAALQQYDSGSLATSINVLSSSSLSLIFLINPTRFAMVPTLNISARGINVSQLAAAVLTLSTPNQIPGYTDSGLR